MPEKKNIEKYVTSWNTKYLFIFITAPLLIMSHFIYYEYVCIIFNYE